MEVDRQLVKTLTCRCLGHQPRKSLPRAAYLSGIS